jgi:hypothetical protein
MEYERRLVSKAHAPIKKDPPKVCSDAKTIGFDSFKTKLMMFKDNRPEAQDYIKEVLPSMLTPPNPPEASIKFYNTLNGSWLEFDFTDNTLYLCSLRKKT